MKRFYFLALLLFVLSNLVYAQITKVSLLTKSLLEYEKSEWDIELKEEWSNPYLQKEVALDMLLTAPSGKRLTLPCYFVAGKSGEVSTWKARFAPQEKGTYKYNFVLLKGGTIVNNAAAGSFSVKPSRRNGILHLKDNWTFQYDNGRPFRGIGENIGWESRANDDSRFFKQLHEKPKYNYEYMLRALAAHGGNYFRTWISSFNLPLDWKKGFNSTRYTATTEYFNPSAITKLDRLVELSDSLDLHMMLTLGQGAYHTRDGGFANSAADFFVNPEAKQQYRDRLRYIVARWGYSSAIGAWEFFNEVDNVQFSNKNNPIDAESIVKWHDDMSAYLKKIDPYEHLVTTSISHRDLKGLNALPNLDFNQKHIYKNTKGIPSTINKYEADFNKPYVIGEYSYEWDWSKDFNLFGKEMDSDFKRGLWYGLFSPTPILPLSWWWEYFDDRKTDEYLIRVKTISDMMLAAGKGTFKTVTSTVSSPEIETYSVKCGDQTFAYFFNTSDTAQSVNIEIDHSNAAPLKVQAYYCQSGKFNTPKNLTFTGNKVSLKGVEIAPKSDIIFIIKKAGK